LSITIFAFFGVLGVFGVLDAFGVLGVFGLFVTFTAEVASDLRVSWVTVIVVN
jgi:hypothetical protein